MQQIQYQCICTFCRTTTAKKYHVGDRRVSEITGKSGIVTVCNACFEELGNSLEGVIKF
jgi:hypothetical protein